MEFPHQGWDPSRRCDLCCSCSKDRARNWTSIPVFQRYYQFCCTTAGTLRLFSLIFDPDFYPNSVLFIHSCLHAFVQPKLRSIYEMPNTGSDGFTKPPVSWGAEALMILWAVPGVEETEGGKYLGACTPALGDPPKASIRNWCPLSKGRVDFQ